ncbi:MAG: class I SAM-dependent methyltransferase [Novosphingobium sp.]
MALEQTAFEITAALTDTARACAPDGVSSELSDYDQLLGFLIKIPSLTPIEAVEAYFAGGRDDAARLVGVLQQLNLRGGNKKILEFASGYGRVTRHLKRLLCENIFSASDIHPAACATIRTGMGVPAYVSSTVPEDLDIPGQQDFVFALSLFSHLPLETQGRWLKRLYGLLAQGGHLMFTTHGDHAMRKQREFFTANFDPKVGFGYRSESDQLDLSSDDYGTAVVTMPFIYNLVNEFVPDAEIVSFRSSSWFDLQDEWIIKKP